VKKKQGDWESYSLGTLRSINSEYVFIEIWVGSAMTVLIGNNLDSNSG
jgi:hypothetical protein